MKDDNADKAVETALDEAIARIDEARAIADREILCDGCYKDPCACLSDDCDCDPN